VKSNFMDFEFVSKIHKELYFTSFYIFIQLFPTSITATANRFSSNADFYFDYKVKVKLNLAHKKSICFTLFSRSAMHKLMHFLVVAAVAHVTNKKIYFCIMKKLRHAIKLKEKHKHPHPHSKITFL
jgi:hypothetical protein